MKRPNTCVNLIKAINMLSKGKDAVRVSRCMANIIVGQMLPDGVVKGGSSLMFRYGEQFTRYTRDVDTARVMDLQQYKHNLDEALSKGWNGFTGELVEVPPPEPEGVPKSYVMIPYDIKLKYIGRPWQTIRIEIGHNEIGDADDCDSYLPEEMTEIFEQLSFPKPQPLPLMKLSYQIAQKLHAVSEEGSVRAHDLIDLQLMALHSELDYADIRSKCLRLFDYRREQSWPPKLAKGETWKRVYEEARATLRDATGVLESVDDAVVWANELIAKIVGS